MKKSLVFIFGFLLILCVSSFIAGWSLGFAAPFYLSAVSLILFGLLFFLEILGYEIGGSLVTIRKQLNNLEQQNTELKESVTALAKAIYMVSSENAPAFGFNRAQSTLIDNTLAPINHLIDGDIKAAAEEDLKKVIYHDNP